MTKFNIAKLVIAAAVAMVVTAAAPAWSANKPLACSGQGGVHALPYQTQIPAGFEHDRFVTQPRTLMFEYGPFTSSFATPADEASPDSPYKGIPKWVAYEMRALLDEDGDPIHPQGAKRPRKWYELEETAFVWDGRSDIRWKGIDAAYRQFAVLWNRGHVASRSHANRLSWQEGCNTHVFVNAVPQYADMNQGDWLALENYAVAAANKFGKVWTIAGPVFEDDREVDVIGRPGTAEVAIPHALFKILVIETGGRLEARAFLFPQADEDHRGQYRKCAGTPQSRYDFNDYATSIKAIETATGLRFFTAVAEAQRKSLDAASAAGPWPVEARFYDERCGRDDDEEEDS